MDKNGGYYIGRYEQGEGNVCKSGANPYTNITRDQAKSQSEVMYSGNSYITSELISSYAWDTALNFICQTNSAGYVLATTNSKNYGNINTNKIKRTGEYTADEYSNIYDIIGNCIEWTTECNGDSTSSVCVYRCSYYSDYGSAARRNFNNNVSNDITTFRVQLYIK